MAFVYLLISSSNDRTLSYIGWTYDLKKRITLHNQGKGAKFTKGRKWKLAYYEIYKNKIEAMRREYSLKKDRKLRNFIKKNYIHINKNN